MKLSTKIFVIILSIAVIPLLIVAYIAYINIEQEITQNVFGKLDSIAQIQKNRIQENLDNDNELLNLFATKPELRSFLSSFDSAPTKSLQKSMNDNIAQALSGSTGIKKIEISDPSGIIVSSTDSSLVGSNVSSKSFFKVGIKQNDSSYLAKDSNTGQIEQYWVGPLMLNGKTIGVEIIISDASNIISSISDYTGLGTTGETLLAKNDGNGNALFLTPTRFDKNAALTRIVKKNQTNIAAIHAINGEEKTFDNLVDYRGVPVFSATRYIKSVGWGIVVKIDRSEALAPVRKEEIISLFVFLAGVFLTIVAATISSSSIARPIKKIVVSAQKITAGDLSQTFSINSKDEIGNLSHYLNKMVESLKNITTEYKDLNLNLKKEVKLQTAKFENQNAFLSDANKAVLNLSEDLQEEKRKLEIEKTNTESVLASIGDALIVIDSDGIITMINSAAEKMFGYHPSELIGKSIFDLLVVCDENDKPISRSQRAINISLTKKEIMHAEYVYIRQDKIKFIISATSAPVVLNGKVIGGVDVFRDITKEKQIDKTKTEFVSLASHQLRTPATAVKWYSEMLSDKKNGKLNAKQTRYLTEIYHGNERMIKLIDNLLSVSRIELGKISVKNETVDTGKLLKDVIDEQKVSILKMKHRLTVEQPAGGLKISTDPILLGMILQNFISNAVKYTLPKGKIICAIEKKNSKILFSVKDNGVGIPTDEQKRIFEKLFRASNSLELDKEGNGLGLYIVRQVAADLGGKVWFESEPEKGTTFYLELPLENKV